VLEDEKIMFYRLFNNKAFYRANAPGVGLSSYFSCESDTKFEESRLLHIKMKCDDSYETTPALQEPISKFPCST